MAAQSIGPGTHVGERWRIVELIGEGGFGQVFRAVDESSMALGDAAVKVLHPNTSPLERSVFTKEVQRMATLRHQNLVGYLDSGQMEVGDEVHSYLVAEFCTGALDVFVREQPTGRLGTADLLEVIGDISAGLAYLHSKQMVHRDIKPANVMYGDGAWKLGDFGLTRDLTATGSYHRGDSLRGTPLYMSPELFSTMTATAPSDIYAVGVSAHLCASGRPLHQGSGQALIQNIMSSPVSIDPSLDAAVQDLIYQCTLADPQARISAADLHHLVTTYKSSPHSAPVPPAALPPNPMQNHAATSVLPPSPPSQSGSTGANFSSSPDIHGANPATMRQVPTVSSQFQGYPTPPQDVRGYAPQPKKSKAPLYIGLAVAAILLAVLAVPAVLYTSLSSTDSETAGGDSDGVTVSPRNGIDENPLLDGDQSRLPVPVEPGNVEGAAHLDGGCQDGPGSLGLVTNLHDSAVSYRIEYDEFDSAGVKVGNGIETVRALGPGQSSIVDFVSLEDVETTCQIQAISAEESDGDEIARIESVVIEECVLDTFFGDKYDITFTVENSLDVVADADVYFAVVDDQGVRIDEDWAGESVYEIPASGASREDSSVWFSTIERVETTPAGCEVIAVELEQR